ncbi:hypothetical protein [Paenibacillus thiaminolyticus]|uniref:Uncharacterized protein n=1 Tax=Paenibacillus thiaminolyticus TaxID=49283 RepID=A0A3A3GE30_PANTH|nr:hypothetical protein [Paenibacillus thiaminolyticus]RJG22133.1 hypothetical protein DQX05_18710 [Paenibacillus thiaminolyticus]
MVHWDSSNIKQDDVSASSRISIEKITAGASILLSASLRSEDDIMPLFEALCTSLEEEGCDVSDIAELHVHLNKTLEKWFLSK